MEDADLLKTNQEIRKTINSSLCSLNPRSRAYIQDIIILINREIGINKILSIMLFGSQKSNTDNCSMFSDCDLLIIFKDRVSEHHIKEIERYFIALEIKHNFNVYDYNSKIFKKILGVLQSTTGMFISHFLTKQKYWEEINFSKIFRVNKIFSDIFAPKNIVTSSVIDNSTILYGKDLRKDVKKLIEIPTHDMLKSIIMNLFISLFALGIIPFKKLNPIKYTLEAVKWALRASNYYGFNDTISLEQIVKRFLFLEKRIRSKRRAQQYYLKFLSLRREPFQDLRFMIQSLFRVIKIHLKGLLINKITARKK